MNGGWLYEPARPYPHARSIGSVFVPYAAGVVLSVGSLASGYVIGDGIAAILYGAGAAGLVVMLAFIVYAFINVEREWQLEERERIAHLPQPVAPPPTPAMPFPPVRFVQFIWDWREKNGKFPTVDECEGVGKFNRALVQKWYGEAVNAGAIINRTPKQTAGEPAKGWTRERFEEAAAAANTLR